jgi:uncharacterized protein (TIGR02271 family)
MTRTIVALFDTAAEAEQASQRLAIDVGGVRGEVYGSGKAKELSSLSIPSEDTAAFSEGIRRGGAVLYVQVPDGKFEAVAAILETDGAVDISEREATWRREGWTGASATISDPPSAARETRTDTAMPLVTGDDTTVVAAPVGTDMGVAARGSASDVTGRIGTGTARHVGETGSEEVIPIVEERLRVGKRETAHGRVRIRSYVVETPVQEQVTLHEERVQVDRRPVDRPVGAADDVFRERTIEATETSEEAVVSKEARVKEEVVVRKQAEERTETVRDTVRQTKVEVEDERGRISPKGPGTTSLSNDPV